MIYYYYRKPMGIFSPVYVIAFMSLGQILPQLTTIYYLPHVYNPSILYNLLITMISCNLAFMIGYERKVTLKSNKILDIKSSWIKPLIILFAPGSLIFDLIMSASHAGIKTATDGVIAFQFQALGYISLILTLMYLRENKLTLWLVGCLILSTLPILHYAFGIYGSRLSTFTVALLYAYLLAIKFPNRYNLIKKIFTIFFIVGCIGSLSISEIRTNMGKDSQNSISDINFIKNIKKSFTGGSYNERAGMDLGNAALGIDYCFQKNEYNYGSFIWNGFVFNYIPKRLVGENIKTSLIIPFEADKYIQALTNGITCTTGYYDAFSAFSWFGFFVFYFLARIFAWIRKRGSYSTLYMTLFFYMLANSTVGVTHGLQLIFAKIEFLILLSFTIQFVIHKKNIRIVILKRILALNLTAKKLITKRIYNRKYYNQ